MTLDFRHWYAVFVTTGREDAVKAEMERQLERHEGVDAALLVPKRYAKDTNAKDGTKEILKPMFPGYVLVGTEQIELVAELTLKIRGVLKFLQTDDEDRHCQEIALHEIMHVVNMCDEDGIIGVSEVTLDENNRIVVLSGPLKGHEGRITKFNRRKGRARVRFLLGTEWHEIWLAVRVVERKIENV